jgi:hypothetical protein
MKKANPPKGRESDRPSKIEPPPQPFFARYTEKVPRVRTGIKAGACHEGPQ